MTVSLFEVCTNHLAVMGWNRWLEQMISDGDSVVLLAVLLCLNSMTRLLSHYCKANKCQCGVFYCIFLPLCLVHISELSRWSTGTRGGLLYSVCTYKTTQKFWCPGFFVSRVGIAREKKPITNHLNRRLTDSNLILTLATTTTGIWSGWLNACSYWVRFLMALVHWCNYISSFVRGLHDSHVALCVTRQSNSVNNQHQHLKFRRFVTS